jgi:hypothetical protein
MSLGEAAMDRICPFCGDQMTCWARGRYAVTLSSERRRMFPPSHPMSEGGLGGTQPGGLQFMTFLNLSLD